MHSAVLGSKLQQHSVRVKTPSCYPLPLTSAIQVDPQLGCLPLPNDPLAAE